MTTTTSIEMKRHHSELSEKETAEVIATVADMIVTFLKGSRASVQPPSATGSAVSQEART